MTRGRAWIGSLALLLVIGSVVVYTAFSQSKAWLPQQASVTGRPGAEDPTDLNAYYESILNALGEPNLADMSAQSEVYRLVLITPPSRACSVRVQRSGPDLSLTVSGNFDPASKPRFRSISVKEWRRAAQLVEAAYFWDLPKDGQLCRVGISKTWWIFEARRDGRFHQVRQLGQGTSGYVTLCNYFLGLGDCKVEMTGN